MSTEKMSVDAPQPPKLNLDAFIAEALSGTPPELHPFFEKFKTLYTKKLWHQLTQTLTAFFAHPQSGPYRVEVFERFVRDFEGRLNQLKLVEMGVTVARDIDNPQSHLTFLTSLLGRLDTGEPPVTPKSPNAPAYILLLSTIAHSKLLFGDLEGSKKDMDTAWAILDPMDGVDTRVSASYYFLASSYAKATAAYASYYRNSLLYLACLSDIQKDMTAEERVLRAHDLGLAALLGEIYNFGELLIHPILDALKGTEYEWIKDMLVVFNEGDIGRFEALAPLMSQEPILQENYPFLRQKICLMALIDAVFRRTGPGAPDSNKNNNRTMSFEVIAQETHLPLEEVEHLLMKGMSLNLIHASLDQPSGLAHITWVQPRVLGLSQIGLLSQRLDAWVKKLNQVAERIEKSGDVLA